MSRSLYTLLVVLASLAVFTLIQRMFSNHGNQEIDSNVLLERVEKVFKLVTVEGNFSEIFEYEDHYFADVWPFKKKALVRVNARVSVGYNLNNLNIQKDESSKTISIYGYFQPEILSIEHDLDYYNFENGLFNSINNKDVTEISRKAKEIIREKAESSVLFANAENQRKDLVELLQMSLKASGWELKMNNLGNYSPVPANN